MGSHVVIKLQYVGFKGVNIEDLSNSSEYVLNGITSVADQNYYAKN